MTLLVTFHFQFLWTTGSAFPLISRRGTVVVSLGTLSWSGCYMGYVITKLARSLGL